MAVRAIIPMTRMGSYPSWPTNHDNLNGGDLFCSRWYSRTYAEIARNKLGDTIGF